MVKPDPNGYSPSPTKTDFRDVQHDPMLIEHLKDVNYINTSIATVHANHIGVTTFVHEVKYIIEDVEYVIDQSCEVINMFSNECDEYEHSCQYVNEGIVSCSIRSTLINSGALKLTSSKVVTVEVEPIRMRTIEKTNTGEMKVKIPESEFCGNITSSNLFRDFPSTTLRLRTFYWIIIVVTSGAAILFIAINCVCGYKYFSSKQNLTSLEAPTGGQTFIQNNTNLGSSVPRLWSSNSIIRKIRMVNMKLPWKNFQDSAGKKNATLRKWRIC